MKISKFLLICCAVCLGILPRFESSALAQPCGLTFSPNPGPATVSIEAYWTITGSYTTSSNLATFLDTVTVGNTTVPAGAYLGWCIDVTDNIYHGPENFNVLMYSSCDPNLDTELADLGYILQFAYPATDTNGSAAQWNDLNYILNHPASGASYWDIQAALWNFIGGPNPSDAFLQSIGYPTYNSNNVISMVNDTLAHAGTWQPKCGDVIAVVLAITNKDAAGDFPVQLTILQVPFPCVPTLNIGAIDSCYTSLTNADAAALAAATGSNGCGGSNLTLMVSDNGQYCPATITVTGTDACGHTVTATTTATILTNPPTFSGLPAETATNYQCDSDVPPAPNVTAADACGTPLTVTTNFSETGAGSCNEVITRLWTTEDCAGQPATFTEIITVQNTNAPTLTVPPGASLPCNGTPPDDVTVSNEVTISAYCSNTATYTVTHVDSLNGCGAQRVFTVIGTDSCNNTATQQVTFTWTVNSGGPAVVCPPDVTVVTNFCQMYCTFSAGDWGGSCNGGWYNNYNWWQNWCAQNPTTQCWPSWTNWWKSCNGSNVPCTNFWSCWSTNHPTNWWGCWSGSQWGYQTGNWWGSWNFCNYGSQSWVPCGGNNPDTILNNCFKSVYPKGCVTVGLPDSGKCVTVTSCNAAKGCLNWTGNAGILNGCLTNPAYCSAGSFCAQVLALKLNCDFGDYGCAPGFVGKCGDLVLCDSTSPCNGQKVREILRNCNNALGGGACPQGCTVQYLCGLCSNINQCFEGCQVSSWCGKHLCSVYIPSPAQTGTATVNDACSPNPTLTYCDRVSAGNCAATYVISREWIAVDACGNSNTCTQMITIAQTNSCNVSGVVALACGGDTNLSNNEGIAGLTVTLENSQGTQIATTTTGANGNYSFTSLAPGSYIVVVTPPAGYTETYPAAGGNASAVTLTACENDTTVNFAYTGSTPGVQLIKTAPCTVSCKGVITYTFAVTNTGNTCETLTVVDPLLGAGAIFTQSGVAPGQGFLFTSNYTAGSGACMVTNTATAIAAAPNGKTVSSSSTVTTCVTTKCVTNQICGNFNSQNPGAGYVWCNAHISCNPGKKCTIYCQNATVTLSCNDGKTYTYPVPNCQVNFSPNCTTGSSVFDGTKWTTTLPCAGDDEIFLSGCGIPWQADFANCHSVCWTGTFSCDTAGINCNWQWSGACYNCNLSNCGSVSVKPCHQTYCGYPGGDHAGTPENCKYSCQPGACGGGGGNYTGSWSGTGSCSFSCN